MNKIILNKKGLKKKDLDYKVIRVKAFFINSDDEVLLAFNNNTYQFIGGHLNKGESLEKCLIREIKEETGIYIKKVAKPFLNVITYDDNYFDTGKKVENSIYYFRVVSNALPDFDNTSYDDIELQSDFKLFYVKLNEFESFIKKCLKEGTIDKNIGKEMIYAIKSYNEIYG